MQFFVLCTQVQIDYLEVLRVVTETVKENAMYKQNATNYTD